MDLDDMTDEQLEELRKQIEQQQVLRSSRKAVALDMKRHVEDLRQANPEAFATEFSSEGVEAFSMCVHVPIGEPDVDHDPHLQYEK